MRKLRNDPAWAATFMLADAAREARPTTTNEETTTMPIDQSAYVFGEPIPYDHVTAVEALAWLQDNAPTHTQRSDEWTRWSVGARYLASAVAELADERLTISVGRDTAKEARDALAWFQLGQSAPVTIDVEEDCLWVYLDECSISIGVTAETGDEIYVRTSVRQYDVGAYLTEQTQFDAAPLDDEDHDAIVDTVTELMQNLTGFHYLAGGAAVRAIHAEGRSTTLQDIEGIEASRPDKLEFYQSVDGYPNVGRICIDGVALLQTTREYGDALSRVPEWDEWCES